jgi:outer membrane PBP1 activator LpoA protein
VFKLSLGKDSKQISCITFICLILWGCGSTQNTTKSLITNTIVVGKAIDSHDSYLNLSRTASGLNKQAYQLLALRAALIEGQTIEADNLLSHLTSHMMLSDNHQLELQLLKSLRFALLDDLTLAIATLTPNTQWNVSNQRFVTLYKQRANFQIQNEQSTQAITSLVSALLVTFDEDNRTKLRQSIWQEYQLLSLEQLNNTDSTLFTKEQLGWHTLAIISKNSLHSPMLLRQELAQWILVFPSHSAVDNLPKKLIVAANVEPFHPNKITVILPLTGRYARIGQAVQNGLLSNIMLNESQQEIITIDSNEAGAIAAFEQAIVQESDFIIGPLLKENVEQVSQIETSIPTLFLNAPQSINRLANQFYFAMDKESETLQGAHYIYQLGKERPVIVAPDNVSGHQMAQLFAQEWLDLHENEEQVNDVEKIFFTKDSELKKTIEKLFETDKSQARINHVRLLVGNKMKSETRSRRDIDSIYLVANPKQASMLMPSVEVTVSAFASQVPVFVGSSGNTYRINDSGLSHLNQLTVSEIPWFLNTKKTLSPTFVNSLWPKMTQSQLRLFAMGHDAYGLIGQLAQMSLFPEYSLDGFSGKLSVGENGKVERDLSWAQYQRGRLKKIQ